MRYPLKEFQEIAVKELLRQHRLATRELQEGGGPQTIVFSSPTASGKTVMLGALIESVLFGGEVSAEADMEKVSDTTILWLSDKPDLNAQSRRRLLDACSSLVPGSLVIVENDFDQPTFEAGKVYFLNYGKLSTTALLTRPGTDRTSTIWETVNNTARQRRDKFIVVIDEAHYGVQRSREEQALASTIPQRFFVGHDSLVRLSGTTVPSGRLEPMPLIIAVSATVERLTRFLQGQAARTARSYDVDPASVRISGLIKDRIVIDHSSNSGDDWTMLREACLKLVEVEAAWQKYAEGSPTDDLVVPALLVQVNNAISPAAIGEIIRRVREVAPLGDLAEDQIVHCFGDGGEIQVDDLTIRRADPNEIAGDRRIRLVLFKTALNTGWDCPRAEVLMSFRAAEDATNIAQLIGRMVRTPLAKRIVGSEPLNDVYLFLPRYDRDSVRTVINHLTVDREGGGADAVERGQIVTLVPRAGAGPILELIRTLPSEAVPPNRPMPGVRRVLRLARLLERDGIGEALEAAESEALVGSLMAWLAARRREMPELDATISRLGFVAVNRVVFDGTESTDGDARRVGASEADILWRYRAATLKLSPELGEHWLARPEHRENILGAMLEFSWLAQSEAVRENLDVEASERFDDLRRRFVAEIRQLRPEQAEGYSILEHVGRNVQEATLIPEDLVVFPVDERALQCPGHLYVKPGTADDFPVFLNQWELSVLRLARVRPGFLGWLRNLERKPWSLSYSYPTGGSWKPGYPDFIIFRHDGQGRIFADISEPHRMMADSVDKAKGLAAFADKYANSFGRIEMSIVDGGFLKSLEFQKRQVRRHVMNHVHSSEQLAACFNGNLATKESMTAE